MDGKIFVWNISGSDPCRHPVTVLKHRDSRAAIRQLSFTPKGQALISVCDDGTVWIWRDADAASAPEGLTMRPVDAVADRSTFTHQ